MRINKLLVIILILSMTIPVISYAINIENGDKEFLTCESKEVSKGEKVVLNLNLDLIQYENFEFTLTSNTNLGNVSTETEGVEVSYPETNGLKITGNKTELNVKQIDLYYQVPEEIEIGSKIELIGKIKNSSVENEENVDEENIEEQEVIITLTVVEKQENENNEDTEIKNENNEGFQTGDKNNEQMNMEQNIETKATTTSQSQTQSFSSAGSLSSNLSSNVETNTYNGESNNYLSSLEISNYNFEEMYFEKNQVIKSGENILKYTNDSYLVAPYDCVITEMSLPDSGSVCTSKHYITIQSTDTLKMTVQIGEDELDNAYIGQEAIIEIEALDNKEITGYVTNISNTASYSSSGSKFEITVSFENDGSILLGMSAKCSIVLEKAEDAIAVAKEAVQEEKNKKYVIVKDQNGQTKEVEIETGIENDAYVEVTSGLNEGDIVLIEETENSNTTQSGMPGQMNREEGGNRGQQSNGGERPEMPSGGMQMNMP